MCCCLVGVAPLVSFCHFSFFSFFFFCGQPDSDWESNRYQLDEDVEEDEPDSDSGSVSDWGPAPVRDSWHSSQDGKLAEDFLILDFTKPNALATPAPGLLSTPLDEVVRSGRIVPLVVVLCMCMSFGP